MARRARRAGGGSTPGPCGRARGAPDAPAGGSPSPGRRADAAPPPSQLFLLATAIHGSIVALGRLIMAVEAISKYSSSSVSSDLGAVGVADGRRPSPRATVACRVRRSGTGACRIRRRGMALLRAVVGRATPVLAEEQRERALPRFEVVGIQRPQRGVAIRRVRRSDRRARRRTAARPRVRTRSRFASSTADILPTRASVLAQPRCREPSHGRQGHRRVHDRGDRGRHDGRRVRRDRGRPAPSCAPSATAYVITPCRSTTDLFLASVPPFDPADFVNHSCDPNCGIVGAVLLVARRAIEAGEEICFDYAMTDSDDYDEFDVPLRERAVPRRRARERLEARRPPGSLRGLVLVVLAAVDRVTARYDAQFEHTPTRSRRWCCVRKPASWAAWSIAVATERSSAGVAGGLRRARSSSTPDGGGAR